jgi:hypothetical protein
MLNRIFIFGIMKNLKFAKLNKTLRICKQKVLLYNVTTNIYKDILHRNRVINKRHIIQYLLAKHSDFETEHILLSGQVPEKKGQAYFLHFLECILIGQRLIITC